MRDDQSEVLHLFPLKLTLLRLEVQFVSMQPLQNPACYCLEFRPGLSENEDVIHVDAYKAILDQIREDVVHHCLEGCWTVCESEEHHQGLEHAPVHPERGLPLVSLPDSHIVISPPHIQLRKVPGTLQTQHEIVHQRKRVLVLYCDGVQVPIVLDRPERSILLFYEEEGCCERRLGQADPS